MKDYMSIENTTSVNGFFILIVFLNHVQSYVELPEVIHTFTLGIGQLMVAMFLFYSGYGVCESIQKKGMAYVKTIPYKRVAKVLAEFALSVLLFACVDLLCGITFRKTQFLLSLIGWDSIGNSNWYIFVILCMYLITFAGFMMGRGKKWISLGVIVLLTIVLFFVLHEYKQSWWYNTLCAYPFGMFFSLTKKKWDVVFSSVRNDLFLLLGSLAVTIILKPYSSHASIHLLMTLSYCLCVIAITKKVSVFHPILFWLGKHLFEIYILMRIPMILLETVGLKNAAFFVPLSFAATLLLAWGYHWLLQKAQI